jgi:hypothetical protein
MIIDGTAAEATYRIARNCAVVDCENALVEDTAAATSCVTRQGAVGNRQRAAVMENSAANATVSVTTVTNCQAGDRNSVVNLENARGIVTAD